MNDDNPPHGLAPDVEALVIAAQAWRAGIAPSQVWDDDRTKALAEAVDALDPLGQSFTRNIATAPTAPRGKPTTITVEIDMNPANWVAAMLKAREAAADYRASLDKMNAILSPSIRVSLVLDIIDEVERDHDVDLHDIAARIRERIEEATR